VCICLWPYLCPNDLEPEPLLVSILPSEHELLIPIVKCFLNGNIMVYHISSLLVVLQIISDGLVACVS